MKRMVALQESRLAKSGTQSWQEPQEEPHLANCNFCELPAATQDATTHQLGALDPPGQAQSQLGEGPSLSPCWYQSWASVTHTRHVNHRHNNPMITLLMQSLVHLRVGHLCQPHRYSHTTYPTPLSYQLAVMGHPQATNCSLPLQASLPERQTR